MNVWVRVPLPSTGSFFGTIFWSVQISVSEMKRNSAKPLVHMYFVNELLFRGYANELQDSLKGWMDGRVARRRGEVGHVRPFVPSQTFQLFRFILT
jgi:hypothetical protein